VIYNCRKEILIGILLTLSVAIALIYASIFLSNKTGNGSLVEKGSNSNLQVRLEKISDQPTSVKNCQLSIQFINERDAWLSCNGILWASTDGGKNWKNTSINTEDTDNVFFQLINPQMGWKYTEDKVMRTEDGGYTWGPINIPIKTNKGLIRKIIVLNGGKQIWLAGGIFEPISPSQLDKVRTQYFMGEKGTALSRIIFHSIDAGKTWKKQQIESRIGSELYIYISNQEEVWALSYTELFHLKEGAWRKIDFKKSQCKNQSLIETTTTGNLYGDVHAISGINFADIQTGWIWFTNGSMAKSTDGGQTWCDLLKPGDLKDETGEPISFMQIYFTDANIGFGLADNHKLYKTIDGGTIWSQVNSQIKFSEMFFLDAMHGWVLGNEGLFRIVL
jgi:photosystem II stability/assembly factor-like uncharacterized protein